MIIIGIIYVALKFSAVFCKKNPVMMNILPDKEYDEYFHLSSKKYWTA